MRTIILALALTFAASAANAQATCTVEANNKKLAGAAKTSFLKKCESDAKALVTRRPWTRSFQARPKPASRTSA